MPIRNVTRPAGANTFSPMNAACWAIVTTFLVSFARWARMPSTIIVVPPPTQITAKSTWTALKSAYQLFGSTADPENANTSPTTTTPARIA